VRLEHEGYRERRFRVNVRPGSVTTVFIELREAVGRVLLKIQGDNEGQEKLPFDPRISVDGVPYASPALELPAGFRTILVRAFGWEDASVTLFVEDESYRELELKLKPAPFKLSNAGVSRRRFNPANPGSLGTTALSFEVSAPGRGNFLVLDSGGKTVFARELGPFETWYQSALWDGRDSGGVIQDDGTYTLAVEAVSGQGNDPSPVAHNIVMEVILDSSRIIFPLSLASGKSGLLFAPLAVTLPPGSFQIEGSLSAGDPCGSGGLWKSLPFAAAFRVSVSENMEISAALNVIPKFSGGAGAGIGGGFKWVFLNYLNFGAAASVNFSWTGKTPITPFGMASGFELNLPLKLDLGKLFTAALSPGLLWTGDEGFPWEDVPRLLVSGGLLLKMNYFTAGLSVRTDFKFSRASSRPPFIITGGEVCFFPPPSSFVFSFNGGAWVRDGSSGGFFGFGIGMIY